VVLLLIVICAIIPYRLAFIEKETSQWETTYIVIDSIFVVDIIITFFTSYQDDDKMTEITDKKKIAINYLRFWFWIDTVSVLPIDLIIQYTMANSSQNGEGNNNLNLLLRVAKMGKIYKLIRLVRLVKLFKILKNRDKLQAQFSKSLEINAGQERLIFCSIISFFMMHIFACGYVLIGQFE
jgi:hypothetical protein